MKTVSVKAASMKVILQSSAHFKDFLSMDIKLTFCFTFHTVKWHRYVLFVFIYLFFFSTNLLLTVQLNESISEVNDIIYSKGDWIQITWDLINDVNFKIFLLLLQQTCTYLSSRGFDPLETFLTTAVALPAISQDVATRVDAILQVASTWSTIQRWWWVVVQI